MIGGGLSVVAVVGPLVELALGIGFFVAGDCDMVKLVIFYL